MRDKTLLKQLQALPLNAKVLITQQRIREWYNYFGGKVFISFSGGKDSTVLAHLVHGMYPDVPLVFSNTGLEYPEIQKFARDIGAEFLRPKMSFSEVISTYGYPIISKEVAEAIHFARRIVPVEGGGWKTERVQTNRIAWQTATRKRTELEGQRTNEIIPPPPTPHEEQNGTQRNQTDSQALKGRTGWRRANLTGNTPPPRGYQVANKNGQSCEESRDSEGNSWGNRTGVGSSQFNKLKWLPLCQESQFYISHYCCNVMKKSPMGIYQRKTGFKPYIGTLAEESRMRAQAWIRHGCNAFESHKQTSQPLSFWTEQDILLYILENDLNICSVYGEIVAVDGMGFEYEAMPYMNCQLKCTGCQRTGCVFCGFGAHLEKGETRFQRLAKTHPKQYEYCIGGGQWVDNPKYDPTAPKMDGDWQNWNPKKVWVPSKQGLGMKKVFDDCNQIYGKDFIRYE